MVKRAREESVVSEEITAKQKWQGVIPAIAFIYSFILGCCGVLQGFVKIPLGRDLLTERLFRAAPTPPPLGNCFFDISARQLYLKTSRYCHIAVKPQKRRSKDGEEGQTFARLTG